MKIAGSILLIIFSFFGSLLMLADMFSDKGGALLAALFGLCFVGVQCILGIVSFFKPKGAGLAAMVTGGIMLVFAMLTQGWFTAIVEVLVAGSGAMLYIGSKNDPA
jgi:hypothetical protein